MRLGRFVTTSCCAECAICCDMARAALTSWKTITAPITQPARSWIGAADEDTIDSQPDCSILRHGHLHGISSGLPRGAINNLKDFGDRFADGSFAGQPVMDSATRLR